MPESKPSAAVPQVIMEKGVKLTSVKITARTEETVPHHAQVYQHAAALLGLLVPHARSKYAPQTTANTTPPVLSTWATNQTAAAFLITLETSVNSENAPGTVRIMEYVSSTQMELSSAAVRCSTKAVAVRKTDVRDAKTANAV